MNRSAVAALLVAVMLLASVPLIVAADDHYTITVENGEIDVPERTVEVEGQEFTVSSIASIEPGEELSVSVVAPEDGLYNVHLYDEDYNIEDTESFTGDDSASYDTTGIDPGTYSLVVEADGVFERIQPVVITAYETTVSVPESVSEDESFTVDISTTEHSDVDAPTIETVEVVIADGGSTDRITATEDDANEAYTATVDNYSPGEYRLFVSVSASEDPDGDSVDIISMSDERSLTVTEAETDDGNDGDGGGGAGGAGGGDGVDSDDGTTDDATDDEADTVDDEEPTETDDPETDTTDEELNATDDGPDDADDVTNATDDGADGTDDTDGDATSTGDDAADEDTDGTTTDGDDDGVIRPQENSTATDTDDDAALGAVQLLVGGMMALGIALRIRRDRQS